MAAIFAGTRAGTVSPAMSEFLNERGSIGLQRMFLPIVSQPDDPGYMKAILRRLGDRRPHHLRPLRNTERVLRNAAVDRIVENNARWATLSNSKTLPLRSSQYFHASLLMEKWMPGPGAAAWSSA